MMKHDLDYMIAVMKAAKEGNVIEYFDKDNQVWHYTMCPEWDWNNHDYRIKPEEKIEYVPYESAEEYFQGQKEHGIYILDKILDEYIFPAIITSEGILFKTKCGDLDSYSFDKLLHRGFRWQDGTPCGKLK